MAGFLVMGSGEVLADGRHLAHPFWDFDYAKHVWTTMKTRAEGVAEWERVTPAFEAWRPEYERNPQAALEALKTHPQRDLIRQGHDMTALYEMWKDAYGHWRGGNSLYAGTTNKSPVQWNEEPWRPVCSSIRWANLITQRCDDLPDWRTDNDRDHDAQVLADWQARHGGNQR